MAARRDHGNFGADLAAAAERAMGKPFLTTPRADSVSYEDFFDRVGRVAATLISIGVRPGDRVLVQVEKSADAVALYVACLWSGAVHVPLNPAFTADEVAYFLDDADPTLLVAAPERPIPLAGTGPTVPVLTLDAAGGGSLPTAAAQADWTPPVRRDADDLAALLYTSGTTGRPKGAALSHENLRLNARALHDAWRFRSDDHLVHALPIFHVHGLFVALHCAMLSAIEVTFLPRFDPADVIDALAEATVFMGVPTHYARLLDRPEFDATTCTTMRLFLAGSAPLSRAAFDAFTERTGHRICERYGMSETLITTSNPCDGDRVAGTVGYPIAGVEMRVTGADGTPVAENESGVVEVRGAQVMSGYWRRPEATQEARRADGWFVTGDIGSLASDDRLTLRGRSSDLIISGGENVYPKEVELVLDSLPGIEESAVIGLADDDLGERVTAVIVAPPSTPSDETIAAALEQTLARFKHPRRIIRVDALPRNAMGKVQRNVLRRDLGDQSTC